MTDPQRRRADAERLARDLASGWEQPARPTAPAASTRSSAHPGTQWLALPTRSPRVLLPRGRPQVAARTLLAHDGLRRPGDRARRRALALLVGSGLPDLAWRSARVGGRSESGPSQLVDVLREQWHGGVAALSLTVRTATPNHKPTFVAVDARGRPLGYGKIAPTPGVAERLDREADGLRWVERTPLPGLCSPEVLAELDWHGCRVLVVSPLPARSRRYPVDDRAPGHLLELARSRGRVVRPERVAGDLVDRIRATGDEELLADARAAADELRRRWGGVRLDAGRLHGDWVPWNLALHGRDVWAWDWEHSERDSAAALDLVHWHLLVHRDRRRLPLAVAVGRSEAVATADLVRQGVDPASVPSLLLLGRLRIAARAAELYAASGLRAAGERAVVRSLLSPQPGWPGRAERASS